MKFKHQLIVFTFVLSLALSFTPLYAASTKINSDKETTESVDFVYFYVNICESCTESQELMNEFLDAMDDAQLDVNINFLTYNISYYDGHDYDVYLSYLEEYSLNIKSTTTPIMFIGDTAYQGEEGIKDGLATILSSIKEGSYPETPLLDKNGEIDASSSDEALHNTFDGLNFLKTFGIGIINGLNPCSFSMLLLLLSLLIVKDVPLLKMGVTFLAGKFITFVLLGTILYQSLSLIDSESYLFFSKLVIAVFVIILASLNLYDFYISRQEEYGKIKNQLPKGVRRVNHVIIEKLTSSDHKHLLFASLYLLGNILAVSEFLCTGQIYIVTITYMIKGSSALSLIAFSYLIAYSFGFILPPLAAIIVISKTQELFDVSEFLREKMPYIKLITAITLLILGFAIIFI